MPLLRARTDHVRSRGRSWAAGLARLQPWIAVPCSLALLVYPNPLVALAAAVGALPLLGRWIAVGRPWPRTVLDLPLALLLAGALLGATAGLNSEAVALRLSGLLAGLFLYALVVTQVNTGRRFRVATLALLVLSMVAALALVNIVAPFLQLNRLPALAGLADALDPWGLTQGLSDEETLLKRYRLRPSGVGALADMGLALAFAAGFGLTAWRARALLVVPLALFAGVLFVTDSRASLVSGAVTLGALAGYWSPRLLALIPMGGLAVLLLVDAGLVTKGLNLRTLGQRFWFWENSLYLAQEYPVTGVGLGTQSVQLTYRTYFQPFFPIFSHAHNIYLQTLLEQGILGMVGLVALTIGALWIGMRARLARDRWVRAGGLAGLGMTLALVTTGLGEITAVSPIGSALLLVGLGLVAAAGAVTGETTRPQPARPGVVARLLGRVAGRRRATAVAIVVLIGVALATGVGSRLVVATMLNFGSIELNRALVSEETTREQRQRFLDQSLWLLRTAAELDQGNPSIQRNLAIALAATDDNRRARQAADRARGLTGPEDPRGMFQVGRAYAAAGNWGEAIKAWEAAEAAPQLLQLGQRLVKIRNWDQALAAFRAAATLTPDSRGAYEGVVRAARGRDDEPDEVARQIAPLIGLGGEHEYFARLELARYLREIRRPTAALEQLGKASRIRIGADHALVEGAVFVQLGRYSEAEPLLARAVAAITEQLGRIRDDPLQPNRSSYFLSSDDLQGYYWLAVTQGAVGKVDAAIGTAREALEHVDPNRRSQRTPFLAIIGDGLASHGQVEAAAETYQQGLAVTPDDPHLADSTARVRAVLNGGARNLVANPGFEWEGGWRLVPEGEPDHSDLMSEQSAGEGKRAARVGVGLGGSRYAAQRVTGLRPGQEYRLSARVRTQDARDGPAIARVLSRVPGRPGSGPIVTALARAETRTDAWTTVAVTFVAHDVAASVEVGFPEGSNRGATAWFDEVTVAAADGRR